MMRHRILAILCVLTPFLASCKSELDMEPVIPDNTVELFTLIEPSSSLSRADIGVDGKGSFVENDRISLLYNDLVSDLQLISGRWTPALSWDDIKGAPVFSAFYPVIPATAIKRFDHEVALNQHSGNQFEQSDLLFADPVSVEKGESVTLKFKHLMSCLTVILKGNAYTEEELAAAKIQIKSYNKIQIHESGALGELYDYDKGVMNIPEISFAHKEATTFQAVLCPQKIHEIDYGGGWWLKITIAGKEYKVANPPVTLKDGTPFNLESGKNVTLVYSFYDKDAEFSNKVCWVHGLKNIPDPSTAEWKVFYKAPNSDYTRKHLPWNASYGWYDCSKKSTTDEKYDDMNMCWAATSSNLVHWWYDQNQTFVDEYYQRHPEKKDTMSHSYKNHLESCVFDEFKKNFSNEGGYARNGLDWFFLGKYNALENAAELINKNSGGYFKDVFGENSTMVEQVAITNMDDLTKTLKKAFKNKQAIGFSSLLRGFGNGHAMTIWGAKFDETGNVCAIYYVDNNDGTLEDIESVGLIAARVGEYEGTEYPDYKGRACLENSQGKTAIYIQNLTLLNLRQEDWQKAK